MKNNSLSKIRLVAGLAACVVSGFMAAPAQAAASIIIVNGNAAGVGFNDPTPVAPVGGNPGTTLGAQRIFAFQAAAAKWGATLTSSVEIRILAGFLPLTCTATGAVLGSAGASTVFSDEPEFPKAGTWYPGALADKLAGVDLDPLTPTVFTWDITARFNSNLGNVGCLTGIPFYLGLDNNHGGAVDLVTVLLHEFGHGLGFQTFTDGSTGAEFFAQPSIWDHYLRDQTQGLLWVNMTDAQRAASSLNTHNLVWTGTNVTNNVPFVLLGVPELAVSGPAAGATAGVHAIGTASFGPQLNGTGVTGDIMPVSPSAAGEGCAAFSALDKMAVNGNVALISRGICGFAVKAKNAQLAGAKGVVIVNNVAGVAAPGLGGADPTVTIPAVGITLEDGTALRAALAKRSRTKSGVIGFLGLDPHDLAGADPSGFMQMYTPNPYEPGSSVSHYDTDAFRNVLMEPAINGDLLHEVSPPNDLTFPLLQDIGW